MLASPVLASSTVCQGTRVPCWRVGHVNFREEDIPLLEVLEHFDDADVDVGDVTWAVCTISA